MKIDVVFNYYNNYSIIYLKSLNWVYTPISNYVCMIYYTIPIRILTLCTYGVYIRSL